MTALSVGAALFTGLLKYAPDVCVTGTFGDVVGEADPYGTGTIAAMPNIASVLKSEISRVARKEVRAETQGLKKSVVAYRTEIAALKRRTQALEQEIRRLSRFSAKAAAVVVDEAPSETVRFSPKSLASQRRRLGLSAQNCGLLVGASGQSIYNWEAGKARPRASHLPAIAALRTLAKKEAAARLATLQGAQ